MSPEPVRGLRVAVFDEQGTELVGVVAVDAHSDSPGWYEVDVRDQASGSRFTTDITHAAERGPWALLQDALDQVVSLTADGPRLRSVDTS